MTAPPVVRVLAVPGLPEVRPGDDLAGMVLAALERNGLTLADGDVVLVTSKVVAKAEGRLVPLRGDDAARAATHAAAVAAESVRVVARRGPMVISETRHGFVGANALIDASNTGGDQLVLLPEDPDASAAALRERLTGATGADVAVVLTDTLGRPWRVGQTDVAVGLAGMAALDDYRGRADDDGRVMEATEIAVADELASAAELVKRKTARTPVAIVRGAPRVPGDGRATDLVRDAASDLFRTDASPDGLRTFITAATHQPAGLSATPVDPAAVERATTAATTTARSAGATLRVTQVAAPTARSRCLAAVRPADPAARALLDAAPLLLVPALPSNPAAAAPDPAALLAAGAGIHALRLALHADGLASVWLPVTPATAQDAELAAASELSTGWHPLGIVAAGSPAPGSPPVAPAPPGEPPEPPHR